MAVIRVAIPALKDCLVVRVCGRNNADVAGGDVACGAGCARRKRGTQVLSAKRAFVNQWLTKAAHP
jgi:hypothetical protein